MEVITIESKAFAALVEEIDWIAAYVQESRQRETEQQGQEEKNRRKRRAVLLYDTEQSEQQPCKNTGRLPENMIIRPKTNSRL